MFCDFDICKGGGHLCVAVVGFSFVGVKPFGGTSVFHYVGLRALDVYHCSPVGHSFPGYAGLCLSPHCTVGITDPIHVRILLFSVCWVWYYTYLVMWFCLMISVCSIVLCLVVSKLL